MSRTGFFYWMERGAFKSALLALATALLCCAPPVRAADSVGTEFWITFTQNVPPNTLFRLSIVGDTATSGKVSNADLGIDIAFDVTPGSVTNIDLPLQVAVAGNGTVEARGLRVTAAAPVAVYGLNMRNASSDGFLALPIDALGLRYRVMSWGSGTAFGTTFAVAATQDNTLVTITPSFVTGVHPANVPFQLIMQRGDAIQLYRPDGNEFPEPPDLTGSLVVADKPVAVFGANACGFVPGPSSKSCDYLVEQTWPDTALGDRFIAIPTDPRSGMDVLRVLAVSDGTEVFIAGVKVATLAAGKFHQTVIGEASEIRTSKAASVAQFAQSVAEGAEDVFGDPLMSTVVPTQAYLVRQLVVSQTLDGFAHFIDVAVPTLAVPSLRIDGSAVAPDDIDPVPGTEYSVAHMSVTAGAHTVVSAAPMGVITYGFQPYGAYGYPAAASLSRGSADVGIAKTAASAVVDALGAVGYTISVTNAGPAAVTGLRIDDDLSPLLGAVQWTCAASPGASCDAVGAGDIHALASVPAGGNVVYTVSATAPNGAAVIANSASATLPDSTIDPQPANNGATVMIEVRAASAVPPVMAVTVPATSPLTLLLAACALLLTVGLRRWR